MRNKGWLGKQLDDAQKAVESLPPWMRTDPKTPERYTMNCYIAGDRFPVSTYVTNDGELLLRCVADLIHNSMSGISRFVVLDREHGDNPDEFVGMAPQLLEESYEDRPR